MGQRKYGVQSRFIEDYMYYRTLPGCIPVTPDPKQISHGYTPVMETNDSSNTSYKKINPYLERPDAYVINLFFDDDYFKGETFLHDKKTSIALETDDMNIKHNQSCKYSSVMGERCANSKSIGALPLGKLNRLDCSNRKNCGIYGDREGKEGSKGTFTDSHEETDNYNREKFSPRGPWNELSFWNGSRREIYKERGAGMKVYDKFSRKSRFKYPDSFYIGVNERNDWLFWAEIASIIDYKPPMNNSKGEMEVGDDDWWCDIKEDGLQNRVDLSWNDLLEQMPVIEGKGGYVIGHTNEEFVNYNVNPNDWWMEEVIKEKERYRSLEKRTAPEGKKKILEDCRDILIAKKLAWKLFKNPLSCDKHVGGGATEKYENRRAFELNNGLSNVKRKGDNREIKIQIPGLVRKGSDNDENETNILINKWHPLCEDIYMDQNENITRDQALRAYRSVDIYNGIAKVEKMNPKMKSKRTVEVDDCRRDTIGPIDTPISGGGTAEFHHYPTKLVPVLAKINNIVNSLSSTDKIINQGDIDVINSTTVDFYNPFIHKAGNETAEELAAVSSRIRSMNTYYSYTRSDINKEKGKMTFGQILDLYIYNLKKEFKIINNLCEIDPAGLVNNNEKLYYDLVYRDAILEAYNKSVNPVELYETMPFEFTVKTDKNGKIVPKMYVKFNDDKPIQSDTSPEDAGDLESLYTISTPKGASPGEKFTFQIPSISALEMEKKGITAEKIKENEYCLERRQKLNEEAIKERQETRKKNILSSADTQILKQMTECRCPHCGMLSIDYTLSTHQPEHTVDMLPHDNHQNGAYYFYCNNKDCNAFLGAIWREKDVDEMMFHTTGENSKTDMPLNTFNVVTALNEFKHDNISGDNYSYKTSNRSNNNTLIDHIISDKYKEHIGEGKQKKARAYYASQQKITCSINGNSYFDENAQENFYKKFSKYLYYTTTEGAFRDCGKVYQEIKDKFVVLNNRYSNRSRKEEELEAELSTKMNNYIQINFKLSPEQATEYIKEINDLSYADTERGGGNISINYTEEILKEDKSYEFEQIRNRYESLRMDNPENMPMVISKIQKDIDKYELIYGDVDGLEQFKEMMKLNAEKDRMRPTTEKVGEVGSKYTPAVRTDGSFITQEQSNLLASEGETVGEKRFKELRDKEIQAQKDSETQRRIAEVSEASAPPPAGAPPAGA